MVGRLYLYMCIIDCLYSFMMYCAVMTSSGWHVLRCIKGHLSCIELCGLKCLTCIEVILKCIRVYQGVFKVYRVVWSQVFGVY